jgi:DNA-binding XRE family transcriptional regulator
MSGLIHLMGVHKRRPSRHLVDDPRRVGGARGKEFVVNGPSAFAADFGAGLRKRRLEKNLTQSDLAEQAGLSLKYVGQLERGDGKNPGLRTIERVWVVVGWNLFSQLREPSPELKLQTETTVQHILAALEPWVIELVHRPTPVVRHSQTPRRRK